MAQADDNMKIDKGWDSLPERVVRNETKGLGFEELVREVRESDRRLIEQRSDSLAKELERRAGEVEKELERRAAEVERLTLERRAADRREHRDAREADQQALALQRKEYRRRLKALNGEYVRINDIQNKSVSRELFDAEKRITQTAIDAAASKNADAIVSLGREVRELKEGASLLAGGRIGKGELVGLVVTLFTVLTGVVIIANYLGSH